MAWVETSLLRTFVKNTNADDEAMIALAVDVGCGKVEELCGRPDRQHDGDGVGHRP